MPITTIRQAFDLGLAHHRAGRLDEAESIYRQILSQAPDDPDAWQLLGLIAHDRGRHEEAVDRIGRAVALNPSVAAYHCHLGIALGGAGRHEAAVAAFRTAIGLDPHSADAFYNLGNALRDQGMHESAVAAYQDALGRDPALVEAWINLGVGLKELGQLGEAIAADREAIRLRPECAQAHYHLGFAQALQGRPDQAVASYRRAVALDPGSATYQSQLLQTLHYHPGYDGAAIQAELARWGRQLVENLGQPTRPHDNDRDPNRRLRIGYVSADFRAHACSFYLEHLLSAHDSSQFEVACYAEVSRPDDVTRRCRSRVRIWRDTVGLSDDTLAALIREDAIDILVDLKVHTAENRLAVFARKPAPIQVTWLGYPGSTGLSAVDYRLSDPYLDPPGLNDAFYTEQTVRLADTFWCYDPPGPRPPVTPLPALDLGTVTFGSMNSFCKVNDPVLALWARVLRAVPGATLRILADAGSHRQRTLGIFAQNGVDPRRVEFEPRRARPLYLQLYQQIDIALDTFPYSGATTSLDALLMGVPVVSLAGQTAVSRAGLTILSNVGLPELAASSPEAYVAAAARLAGDLDRLATLRATLRHRLESSPMMDTRRFARQIELAYRAMWQRWCDDGQAEPDSQRPAPDARVP